MSYVSKFAGNFIKNIFFPVILKDFAKLWINSHKHLS